jgi:hypothetical protein
MAGTLTLATLSDGTNSTSSTNPILGSAKAWAQFNGSTNTINGAFNVGSITKNSTGSYTLNLTNAMPNANYSIVGSNSRSAGGIFYVGTLTTSTATVNLFTYNGTAVDETTVCVSVFSS